MISLSLKLLFLIKQELSSSGSATVGNLIILWLLCLSYVMLRLCYVHFTKGELQSQPRVVDHTKSFAFYHVLRYNRTSLSKNLLLMVNDYFRTSWSILLNKFFFYFVEILSKQNYLILNIISQGSNSFYNCIKVYISFYRNIHFNCYKS